jgi:hypothetical protein
MRIEIDVRNPEHFGEVLYAAFSKAAPKVSTPWEHLPERIKTFWGEVARNVMLSAMGNPI